MTRALAKAALASTLTLLAGLLVVVAATVRAVEGGALEWEDGNE